MNFLVKFSFFICCFLTLNNSFAQEKKQETTKSEPRRAMEFKNPATVTWMEPDSTSKLQFFLQPGDASIGIGAGYLNCPCLRWAVHVDGPSGVIKTKKYLISIDSILRFKQEMGITDSFPDVRMFQVAAAKVLFLGGKIGMQFDGITFGHDYDRNINSIVKTGLAAITNIVQTNSVALQFKSGYQFEDIQINRAPFILENSFPQSLVFGWATKYFKGSVSSTFDIRPTARQRFLADADLQVRVFDIKDIFEGYAGLDISYEHDPLREDHNADSDLLQGKLYFEVEFDPIILKK